MKLHCIGHPVRRTSLKFHKFLATTLVLVRFLSYCRQWPIGYRFLSVFQRSQNWLKLAHPERCARQDWKGTYGIPVKKTIFQTGRHIPDGLVNNRLTNSVVVHVSISFGIVHLFSFCSDNTRGNWLFITSLFSFWSILNHPAHISVANHGLWPGQICSTSGH